MTKPTRVEVVLAILESLRFPYNFERNNKVKPDEKLQNEMRKAKAYCDAVGIRHEMYSLGTCSLALIIDSDALSCEETVGRSVVILKNVNSFFKFAYMSGLAAQFNANTFHVFGSSAKAFAFRDNAQDLCRHRKFGISRTLHVNPWCIDLEGMKVTPPKTLLGGLDRERLEIESKLSSSDL